MERKKLSTMHQDYHPPDLAAATPRTPHDNYSFGFQTPEPKSKCYTPGQTKKSRSSLDDDDDDGVLPSFYQDTSHRTPVGKMSHTLRRLKKKLLATPEPMYLESRYNNTNGSRIFNSKRRVGAVLTFILLTLGGFALYCNKYQGSARSTKRTTNNNFQFRPTPISGSLSDFAVELFRDAFETNDNGGLSLDDPLNPGSVFVLLNMSKQNNDDHNLVKENTETFKEMKEFCSGYENYLLEHMSNLLAIRIPDENQDLIRVTSFYGLESMALPHAAEAHYSTSDGRTLLVDIRFAVPHDIEQQQDLNDYQSSMIDAIRTYEKAHLPDYVDASYTGLPLLQADLRQHNSKEVMSKKDDIGLDNLLPESTPSLETYKRLSELFGWGRLSPYRIVFDGHQSGHAVDTNEGFHIMHEVLVELMKVDDAVESMEDRTEEEMEMLTGIAVVNLDSIPQRIEDGHFKEHLDEVMDELFGFHDFPLEEDGEVLPIGGIRGHAVVPHMRTVYDGIAFVRNNPVPFPLYFGAKRCEEKNNPFCPVEMLHHFMHMNKEVTSKDRLTTYVTATLGVDPFSPRGLAWLEGAREKLQELEDNGYLKGFQVAIEGGATLEYDLLTAAKVDVTTNEVGVLSNISYLNLGAWGLVLSLFALFAYVVRSPPLWLLSVGKRSGSYDHKDV